MILHIDIFGLLYWINFIVHFQVCSDGDGRFWIHLWRMCVERRTWPVGDPEETVWSWSTSGSWRSSSSCMRWAQKTKDHDWALPHFSLLVFICIRISDRKWRSPDTDTHFCPCQVEKTRHLLLLREKLGETPPPKSLSGSLSPSLSSGTLSTSTSISSQMSSTTFESAITPSESSGYDSTDIESLVDREKELATKVRHPFFKKSGCKILCSI